MRAAERSEVACCGSGKMDMPAADSQLSAYQRNVISGLVDGLGACIKISAYVVSMFGSVVEKRVGSSQKAVALLAWMTVTAKTAVEICWVQSAICCCEGDWSCRRWRMELVAGLVRRKGKSEWKNMVWGVVGASSDE